MITFSRKIHISGGRVAKTPPSPSESYRNLPQSDRRSRIGSIRSSGRGQIVLLPVGSGVSTTVDRWVFVVVADMKTKSAWIDVTVTPEEESSKDRLGQDIEDTVEYCLGVWCDDVSTLAEAPCDRVEEPKEDGKAATD